MVWNGFVDIEGILSIGERGEGRAALTCIFGAGAPAFDCYPRRLAAVKC